MFSVKCTLENVPSYRFLYSRYSQWCGASGCVFADISGLGFCLRIPEMSHLFIMLVGAFFSAWGLGLVCSHPSCGSLIGVGYCLIRDLGFIELPVSWAPIPTLAVLLDVAPSSLLISLFLAK